MHMPHLTRRMQVLLDEDRYERLERRAADSGRPVAALVRDAIDIAYPDSRSGREQAFEDFLGGPLADHGGPEEVKRDILAGRDDHP